MKFDPAQLKLSFKFFKYLLPYKKQLFFIIIVSLSGTLLSLINPYLTKLVIDEGLTKRDLRVFITIISIGAGVFLLNELIGGLSLLLNNYLRTKIVFELNRKVFKQLHNLSFSWFQDRATGEHLYMLTHDIDVITNFITTTFSQALSFLPRLLLTLAILFYLNYKIAIFSLLLSPFLFFPPYYFRKKMRRAWENLIKNSEGTFKILEETFSHIQLIKIFAKETASIRAYLKRLIIDIRIRLKNTRLEILSDFISRAGNKVIVGLVSLYGGYQVIKGELTLGGLSAITGYMYQLLGLENEFSYFFHSSASELISCKRIAGILEMKTESIGGKDAKKVIFKRGEIIFRNISFGYLPPHQLQNSASQIRNWCGGVPEQCVLKNISFRIDSGSHIGLVGHSGCGKTTLLNLLVRLYDPWEGEVIIDGWNINNLSLHSLRKQIGFVLQEPFLWNDSIGNNIRYAKDDASKEELIRAAQMACIDEFVKDSPAGFNTIIGENACKISEGQKQRLAIARAVIKRPKILILDEAFSSLDSQTEERIIDNLKKEFRDSTVITVSHRFSTVQKMDLVYFLESPSSMAIGSHEELLERNQGYRELFASQNQSTAASKEEGGVLRVC